METFLSQKGESTIISQRSHCQLDGCEASQKDRAAVGVKAADGIQYPQAIVIVVIVWRKGKVHDRDPMRLGFEIERGIIQIGSDIYFQTTVRKDFADDLLPGMVVLDHEGP